MPGDGMRHELVDGELRVMPPAGAEHGRVAWTVAGLLFAHVRERGGGVGFGAETGFLIGRDPDTVRAPDAAFVLSERYEAVGATETFWPGAPDFVAEVVAPGDTFSEVEEKAFRWLGAGTKVVLVLDPGRRSASVYRPGGKVDLHGAVDTVDLSDAPVDTLDLSDAVPGWRVTVADLFG